MDLNKIDGLNQTTLILGLVSGMILFTVWTMYAQSLSFVKTSAVTTINDLFYFNTFPIL